MSSPVSGRSCAEAELPLLKVEDTETQLYSVRFRLRLKLFVPVPTANSNEYTNRNISRLTCPTAA